MTDKPPASSIISNLHDQIGVPPTGQASDLIDADRMTRQGEELARQQREAVESVAPPRLVNQPPR